MRESNKKNGKGRGSLREMEEERSADLKMEMQCEKTETESLRMTPKFPAQMTQEEGIRAAVEEVLQIRRERGRTQSPGHPGGQVQKAFEDIRCSESEVQRTVLG